MGCTMHRITEQYSARYATAQHMGNDLGCRLRDGVLQDLVAISLLIVGARQGLHTGANPREVDAMLAQAQRAAEGDLDQLRAMIDELRPSAA